MNSAQRIIEWRNTDIQNVTCSWAELDTINTHTQRDWMQSVRHTSPVCVTWLFTKWYEQQSPTASMKTEIHNIWKSLFWKHPVIYQINVNTHLWSTDYNNLFIFGRAQMWVFGAFIWFLLASLQTNKSQQATAVFFHVLPNSTFPGAVTVDRLIYKASFNKARNQQALGNLIFWEAFSSPIMWPNTLTFPGSDISTFTAAERITIQRCRRFEQSQCLHLSRGQQPK